MTEISQGNKEFPAIESVWYGFEMVWQNLKQLVSYNIEKKTLDACMK